MPDPIFDNHQWDFAMRRYDRANDVLRAIVIEEIKEKINDHDRKFSHIALIAKNADTWRDDLGLEAECFEPHDHLQLPENRFDLVLHLHALHRQNDVVGQLIQSRLALAPDGLFLASFLGGDSLMELRHAFSVAESKVSNGLSPHIAPMIDIKDAGNLLARAGFALPVADGFKNELRYATPRKLLLDLRHLGLSNPLWARRKNFSKTALFEALEREYSTNFTCETGQVYASFEPIFLTGYAPSQSQPKPLRPGSITKSFGADMEN